MGKGNAYENVTTPAEAAEFILFRPGTTENVTYANLRKSLLLELDVDDPEGVVTATAPKFGFATDGTVWHKATGIGNTGWVQVVDAQLTFIGGGGL